MSKRVLISGGAGFIGRHLCRRLLEEGCFVTCIDNFATSSYENISDFVENSKFTLLEHDITLPLELEADEIYNLACPASPKQYQSKPVQTMRSSLLGAMYMLELARKNRCRIFQASTSEIYGDPLIHPQSESYWGNVNTFGPRACYDESKRCVEALFYSYHKQYGVDIKIARIFNTFGPYMQKDDGRVISNFIVQALSNEPLSIHGDGTQTRSFCYVDDLIDGMIMFMKTHEDFTGPLNLGNPHEISILKLAKSIINMCQSKSNIEFLPLPQDDPIRRRPDITMAKSTLGWQPEVKLEEGLDITVRYFKESI